MPLASSTVDLIKSIAWPVVTLLFVISIWSPLYDTISYIPKTLENSSSITVGELSIKMQDDMGLSISDDVKNILKRLDDKEVLFLVKNQDVRGNSFSCEENLDWQDCIGSSSEDGLTLLHLYDKKLYTQNISEEHNLQIVSLEITPLGQQTQLALVKILSYFAQKIGNK